MIRWTALKGIAAIILFLAIAALAEYLVVLYAISQGVTESALLQYSFRFPGTDWLVTIAISPLFHLVPIAVIIALTFSWTYLTKKIAVKPRTTITRSEVSGRTQKQTRKTTSKLSRSIRNFLRKIKSGFSRARGISYVLKKVHFARATSKSALIVLTAFMLFAFVFILLTYPQLIYRTVSGAYENNSSLHDFVISLGNSAISFGEVVWPIGRMATAVNNALLAAAPTIRGIGVALGNLIKPVTQLDSAGKYLVFQNAAAWVSVFAVLFYGEYWRKGYRYRRKPR
jgi:hypothetical protein